MSAEGPTFNKCPVAYNTINIIIVIIIKNKRTHMIQSILI